MHALWTRLRHRAASLMLVAMAALVLHGAALAAPHRHAPGLATCGASAVGAQAHGGDHHHGAAHHGAAHHGTAHHGTWHHSGDHHATALGSSGESGEAHGHASAGHDHDTASGQPCCGSFCAVALWSPSADAAWAPLTSPAVPLPAVCDRLDDPTEGLKRPPRTPGIA